MNLAAAGHRGLLRAQFSRALELAETTLGLGIGLKIHWLWAAVAMAALLLGLGGPSLSPFTGRRRMRSTRRASRAT